MTRPAHEPGLHVVVSGASGLIGSEVVSDLRRSGHRVRRLVRRPAGPEEITWDPASDQLDPAQLEGVDGVIHLAGESIGTRWSRGRKIRIRESRVRGTRLLSQSLAKLHRPPRVMISASAVGIYGDRKDQLLTELSPPGDPARDFLVSVCLEWEAAAEPARAAGVRVVHPRMGVVLSPKGGALHKMLLPFRLGAGGRVGSGRQWMSWIALTDVVGAMRHILANESLSGPVNLSAPEPVTNRDFTRILARTLGRPAVLPVPAAALRAVFGEMADYTLLSSARVLPARLLESGYRFEHSRLESALRAMLGKQERSSFPV